MIWASVVLPRPGRTIEEYVVERFAAAAGGLDGNLDVFFDALLADVFVEALGADASFDSRVFVVGGTGDDALRWVVGHFAFGGGVHRERKTLTQRAQRTERKCTKKTSGSDYGRAARPFGALED